MSEERRIRDIIVYLFAIALGMFVGLVAFMSLLITMRPPNDWFEPKTENATLEVGHYGTGQTVNPQMTVDGTELQGSEL